MFTLRSMVVTLDVSRFQIGWLETRAISEIPPSIEEGHQVRARTPATPPPDNVQVYVRDPVAINISIPWADTTSTEPLASFAARSIERVPVR